MTGIKFQPILDEIGGNSIRFDKLLQEIIDFGESRAYDGIWYCGHNLGIISKENLLLGAYPSA